jgi:deferrochelatase/peroxidase EfeB
MGAGSVTGRPPSQPSAQPSNGPPSWKLTPPHDTQTQGIVVSGFGDLPSAQALFLMFDWPDEPPAAAPARKGAWLQALTTVAPITDSDGKDERAASIAFTWTGLQKSGLDANALASFSAPFREGMYQEDRLRRLGDRIKSKWQGTVIDGGPQWSGNTPVKDDRPPAVVHLPGGKTAPAREGPRRVTTPVTVHALLLLYHQDVDKVQKWAAGVTAALAPHNVKIVRCLALDLHLDENGVAHEHFGFADGLSQPIPFGARDGTVVVNGKPAPRDPWHGVPLGEILLGHTNAHAEKSPGPVVLDNTDPSAPHDASEGDLKREGAPEGFLNLGLNGSYMVVRELRQYVGRFWTSLEENAQRIRAHDPAATHVTAKWLAERVVGRSLDGHMLCPAGLRPPDPYNLPDNAFGYVKDDRYGQGCPLGSHVRRANPRDGLAKDHPAAAQTLLDAANNHRILRRGRKFGPPPKDRSVEDGAERGLLFICLNADIARQFEFVQQTWILNKNFATLYDETDPLVGPKGGFTIGEQPLRRIVDVETFIQSAGGEYFFLPSLPALKYLASL